MDLEKLVRAAPIGLFMLVGSYLAARRRKSGWARAAEEYPEAARRLGLEFRAPAEPGRIGTMRGNVQGYRVFVDPDERPRVVLYFIQGPALVLRTFEHEKRSPNGMARFETGSSFLDGFFKDRYAPPELVEALAKDGTRLEATIRKVSQDLGRNLAHLSVTDERVECALDFGRPSHIPAGRVERLVPELVELSRLLEALAAGSSLPPEEE
jgi:hypothetical protein